MAHETETWTVRRLLEWTTGHFTRRKIDPPRLSAEQLLAHVLGIQRIKLYTDYDRVLDGLALGRFRELVKRAAEGEPIAYLTDRAYFFNLEFEVTRDVLIPRPDSETIVEHALQWLRHAPVAAEARILDLCTGSGCLAAAIAHHYKNCTAVATDVSAAAIAVARRNVDRLGLAERVELVEGDLFEPLAKLLDQRPFDVLVSNPPYIPTGQIETLDRSVRDFEPILALDGGLDGLTMHRRILAGLTGRLNAGARVYLEIAFDQAEAALALARQHPELTEPSVLRDQAGHDRVLTGVYSGK